MSYKIEHKFFVPRWNLDLAKYHFAQKAKIKGFRQGVIDRNLLTVIDIRYGDFLFNETIEESTKEELSKLNAQNPVISYDRGEVRGSENNDGWYVTLTVEIQNPPEEKKEENLSDNITS